MKVLRSVLLTVVLSVLLVPVAQAAPIGGLKQYRLPTADSVPRYITNGSDGNRWFTESSEFVVPAAIGRITPAGVVSEFPADCTGCILNDIVQGPANILYFTSNDPFLGRITTAGDVLPNVPMPDNDVLAGNLAAHGDDIWITDFNNDSLWRYDIPTGIFTQFVVPEPADVAVDAAGMVWFTAPITPAIGRLDPATGTITMTSTTIFPRDVAIATDGQVWFTARFSPQGVGRLDPTNGVVTEFPVTDAGPQTIAAAPDGSLWFTQTTKGNIARIMNDGVITETKAVKGSQPFGITVDAEGDPWYTMMAANKVAEFQLR